MSFSDFRGIWWVKDEPKPRGEEPGHRVVIGGNPDHVTVLCVDDGAEDHGYYNATYKLNPERIEVHNKSGNVYAIMLTRAITCTLLNSDYSGPGSWTAEDNAGGMGGNEAR
jgi:hypothetical protein